MEFDTGLLVRSLQNDDFDDLRRLYESLKSEPDRASMLEELATDRTAAVRLWAMGLSAELVGKPAIPRLLRRRRAIVMRRTDRRPSNRSSRSNPRRSGL